MAKLEFRSILDLENYTMSKIELVMDEVYEKLLDKLLEIIRKDVYEAYEPEFY